MEEKMSPVTCRAQWQHYMTPKIWADLMVYLYSGPRGEKKADENFERIKQPDRFDFNISGPMYIKRGTKILIKPEIPGFQFSPEESIVIWNELFHPLVFQMMTDFKGPFPLRGKRLNGQVKFFVGPLLINEININVTIKERLSGDEKAIRNERTESPYRKIFVSYAREDLEIIEKVEKAFDAFGDKFMRDVKTLRCGEEWEPPILELIKEADVFYLFWSKAAKKSPYVKKEWREALKQGKYIRACYWEKPMPEPPPELKKLHFSYLKF